MGEAMRYKTRKAFSFIELLIAMIIIGIVGGVAVTALWFAFNSFYQIDDYTAAESEIEFAVQRLFREFAMIGLGMPNNRQAKGSFAMSFRDPNSGNRPIMALFGDGSDWGGPVTVSNANPTHVYNSTSLTPPPLTPSTTPPSPIPAGYPVGSFVGPELYYAWAVPTGIRARIFNKNSSNEARNNDTLTLVFYAANANQTLKDAGLKTVKNDSTTGRNMRTWVLFPTLRLPLRAEEWDGTASLDVTVAPAALSTMNRKIMSLDEAHLMQAARLYRDANTNRLMQVIFGENYEAAGAEPLAQNIVGLQFAYNPTERLLTMYIAARGQEIDPGAGRGAVWPSWLPPLDARDTRYRIVVKTLTWRIRN